MERNDEIRVSQLETRVKELEDRLNRLAPKDTTKFALKEHSH